MQTLLSWTATVQYIGIKISIKFYITMDEFNIIFPAKDVYVSGSNFELDAL